VVEGQTSQAASVSAAPPVLLVLAGPAGSGKTTLCERMVAEVPGFSRIVTTTTREPRPGEVDGVHYHFLRPEEFDRRVAEGAFLEWAWVHRKNRYGTLASSVLDPLAAGRSLIINVDVQGVDTFRRAGDANPLLRRHLGTVFIDVPIQVLQARLDQRGETPAEIEHRMLTAASELKEKPKFDYVITSRSRDEDFAELLVIWRMLQARIRAS
jgi:guanylate kinase